MWDFQWHWAFFFAVSFGLGLWQSPAETVGLRIGEALGAAAALLSVPAVLVGVGALLLWRISRSKMPAAVWMIVYLVLFTICSAAMVVGTLA